MSIYDINLFCVCSAQVGMTPEEVVSKNNGKPRSCCCIPEPKDSNSDHGCKFLYKFISLLNKLLHLLTKNHLDAVLTKPAQYCKIPERQRGMFSVYSGHLLDLYQFTQRLEMDCIMLLFLI